MTTTPPPSAHVVQTRSGRVSGTASDGMVSFRGIPYAAPPLGPRWLGVPEREAAWDGTRPADARGATAPQHQGVMRFGPEVLVPGDDYLNLDVHTPDPGAAGLPVLVWIHGGAFVTGSPHNPWTDPRAFLRHGVVVVAITYRLGFEGFLPVPGRPANRGVRDWLAALAWVQECVAAFGGDPGNVTVAGQSAGSEAVLTLLTLPAARGLFTRVIAMSGAVLPAPDVFDPQVLVADAARHAGVDAAALAELPAPRLLELQRAVMKQPRQRGQRFADGLGGATRYLRPTVDGDVVPALPFDALVAGAGGDRSLLIGCTSEEMDAMPRIVGWRTQADDARRGLERLGLDPAAAAAYVAARPGLSPPRVLGRAMTDRTFRGPVARVAAARQAAAAPTWCYEFRWPSPALRGLLGAVHCVDLPFAFDALAGSRGMMVGRRPPQALADEVHRTWCRFVARGDPGFPSCDGAGGPVLVQDLPSRVDAHVHDDIPAGWKDPSPPQAGASTVAPDGASRSSIPST